MGMVMYITKVSPLVNHLELVDIEQVWNADDSAARGDLKHLKKWWNELCSLGPKFSFVPNNNKTKLLVVKPSLHSKAVSLFKHTNIEIVTEGVEYLEKRGIIGSTEYMNSIP